MIVCGIPDPRKALQADYLGHLEVVFGHPHIDNLLFLCFAALESLFEQRPSCRHEAQYLARHFISDLQHSFNVHIHDWNSSFSQNFLIMILTGAVAFLKDRLMLNHSIFLFLELLLAHEVVIPSMHLSCSRGPSGEAHNHLEGRMRLYQAFNDCALAYSRSPYDHQRFHDYNLHLIGHMAQAAREAARRLYKRHNYSNGPLASFQLSSLLSQTYEYLNLPFKPTQRDIQSYQKVLDADQDGKVTLQDLEARAVEYLTGSGVLAASSNYPSSYQNYDYQIKTTSSRSPYEQSYSQSYSQSYATDSYSQSYGAVQSSTSPFFRGQLGDAHTVYSINDGTSQDYPNPQNYDSSYSQSHNLEVDQRPYSEAVQEYLAIVGKVFMTYANPNDFTVTEAEVPSLLSDTYAVLGREGYYPSQEDTQAWMKLCDVNSDGKVEFQDYEYFVVKSLERSGLDLYA